MAIKPELFMAVLAMDSYNRNYNEGLNVTGSQIGEAVLSTYSADESVSFFAQAYQWNGKTVIAYRGTDDPLDSNGHGIDAPPSMVGAVENDTLRPPL